MYQTVSNFASSNWNKRHHFLLNHRNHVPSITQDWGNNLGIHFPVSYAFRLQEDVFFEDPKDKTKSGMRTMRIIDGELSIWLDEQKRWLDKPLSEVPVKVVYFVKGELFIEDMERQLLEFFNRSAKNLKNGSVDKAIFLKVDQEESLKEVMNQETKLFEIQKFCFDGPWEEVMALAQMLHIPTEGRGPAEVRFSLNTPVLKRRYWIKHAVDRNIIGIDPGKRLVYWVGGGPIITYPPDKDGLDYLADQTVGTEDGDRLFHTIKGFVDDADSKANTLASVPQTITKASFPTPEGNKMAITINPAKSASEAALGPKKAEDMSYDEWVIAGTTKGFVEKKAMWLTFFDHATKEQLFKGTKKVAIAAWLQGPGLEWYKKSMDVINGKPIEAAIPPMEIEVSEAAGKDADEIF
jgi:hypothetical protein